MNTALATMTTTTTVNAETRIEAMAKAEIGCRIHRPEARAVKAVMSAGTTKAERAYVARVPAARRWDVTIELDRRAEMVREFGQAGASAFDELARREREALAVAR